MAVTFPFTCPSVPKNLPTHSTDGTAVCDLVGNIWQFSGVKNAWIFRGTLTAPPTVTEATDGLVTPDVYNRIAFLKAATNNGMNIGDELKINPHTDVYWYLFDSSDKLIRFTPE